MVGEQPGTAPADPHRVQSLDPRTATVERRARHRQRDRGRVPRPQPVGLAKVEHRDAAGPELGVAIVALAMLAVAFEAYLDRIMIEPAAPDQLARPHTRILDAVAPALR